MFTLDNLNESNEFLNILIDNISSALFIIDENYKVKNFNNTLKILFNKDEDKFLDHICGNALGCMFTRTNDNKEVACGTTEYCQDCILRASFIESFTKNIITYHKKLIRHFYINDKKTLKYFEYTTKKISYKKEKMILVIINDVTQVEEQKAKLKEQNKTLEKLIKEKNILLGVAAHDLRNPLSAIHLMADLIISKELTSDKKQLFLENIKNSSQHSLDLINDILDVSKIENGSLELILNLENYILQIQHNIKFHKTFAEKKNIDIEFIVSSDFPEVVEYDNNRIKQVFDNLMSNAIKYSYSDTKILVLLESVDNKIITKISDNGQGIPEDELHKLFKPFSRTSVKTTGGEKSTGLGLAIAKKIVEVHGGEIWAENKKEGGAIFSFSFPIK